MRNRRIHIVCDRNVRDFAASLAPGSPMLEIIADEDHKNIESVLSICRWLLEQGADRNAIVYAVGGGVTSDMVGFAASIYKRGVKYVNYPTTLLSQVDAGIGGKTGVNLDGYKNILGVIRMPADTRIYPEVLKTLPRKELLSGAAELLKTFIIEDKGRYEKAVRLLSAEQIDYNALAPLIRAAADVKRRIVERDPYEEGLRRVLNLGHSYAHAIEWRQHTHTSEPAPTPDNGTAATSTQVREPASAAPAPSGPAPACTTPAPIRPAPASTAPLSHGEAVAIGTIRAAEISESLGITKPGLSGKLRADFQRCGLPTELPYPEAELTPAIWKDKKVEGSSIHFVLISKIGKVVVKDLQELPAKSPGDVSAQAEKAQLPSAKP